MTTSVFTIDAIWPYWLISFLEYESCEGKIELHKDANLLSLEQRSEKQLYNLRYKLSKKGMARKVSNRNTRNQYVFKTDVKIGKKI